MDKSKDDRYVFSEFLKSNQHILEEVLDFKFKELTLEKNYNGIAVDMVGEDNYGNHLLVNWQLDKDCNKANFIKIQELIVDADKNKKTTIIYGAIEFNEEMIIELMQDAVFFSEKDIEIIFIKINEDCLRDIKENDRIFSWKKGIRIYNRNLVNM